MLTPMIQPVQRLSKTWTQNSYAGSQSGVQSATSAAAGRDHLSFLQVLSATEQQQRRGGGLARQETAGQLNLQDLLKKMEESNRRMRERVQRQNNG